MTQQQTPRVWVLEDAVVVEPPMECMERVRVVEAEPVAELLERAIPIMREWKHGNSQSILDAEALLRTLRGSS